MLSMGIGLRRGAKDVCSFMVLDWIGLGFFLGLWADGVGRSHGKVIGGIHGGSLLLRRVFHDSI